MASLALDTVCSLLGTCVFDDLLGGRAVVPEGERSESWHMAAVVRESVFHFLNEL